MLSSILRQDEGGVLFISSLCKSILEDKNPFDDGIPDVNVITEQIRLEQQWHG